jgi:carbon-monoxide dehydrogenase small subunit
MSRQVIDTIVNGEPVSFLASPTQTLLDALRDELGLTGTKEGCGSGDCGACSVQLDGRLVCSCLVLAPEAQGRRIDTVEGLAGNGTLHPLQQQFLEQAALQCGFCTPGFLMTATYLLERRPDLEDEREIREALAGNLCRCTGYQNIVDAVRLAARRRRGLDGRVSTRAAT